MASEFEEDQSFESFESFEAYLKHEVKGFVYRFRAELGEAVFECERCGALVTYDSLDRHRKWHVLFAPLVGAP